MALDFRNQRAAVRPSGQTSLGVDKPYSISLDEVARRLATDLRAGLTTAEATDRVARIGFNELASAPAVQLWRKFLNQFNDLVIWLLIAAAIVAGAVGEWTDTAAIIAIVLLNAILGFVQEERAEHALAALQKMAAPTARVVRDGIIKVIPSRDLVPGDVVDLEAGDNISADCRLVAAYGLQVQEAALTGESLPVDKDARGIVAEETALGDRRNMAYMGTVVASGKATVVVVATGMQTELGHIAGLLQSYQAEPTPLQKQLAQLGRVLVVVCLVLVAGIFILELMHGDPLIEAFLLSVSLAVAAVPEGLPAVVTIALAIGLQRMARRNALVRKLPSVETLGSVTVICSDKTGTLTRNEMTVREIVVGPEHLRLTGAGYAPRGQFLIFRADTWQPIARPQDDGDLTLLLTIAARCNHAQISPRGGGTDEWQVVGDPTEGALLVAALKAGTDRDGGIRTLYELPFDSDRKAMSVVLQQGDGPPVMYTKGAPESILERCVAERSEGEVVPLTDERRSEVMRINAEMAARAFRVLALCYRELPEGEHGPFSEESLIFSGLVGMIDPPREEAKESVAICREAGIRPIMITGDHPATATAIAQELGIATGPDEVATGPEIDRSSDEDLSERVDRIKVYARVSAQHKLRVVRAWQRRGEIVAMTGDGVNDAPAIKAADIGIAMGTSGTDVTREASAMILLDDNFSSIVNAVEEGRTIYDNIQKFLIYLLSCNSGEMMLMLGASLAGWPAPLLPVQLLWINLVTDGLAALALGLEPPEPGVMHRRPRPPRAPMLSVGLGVTILFQGILIAAVAFVAFGITYSQHPDDVVRARTIAFCVLVYAELFRAFAARSRTVTFLQLGPFSNPYLFGAVLVSALLQLGVILVPFARPVFVTVTHPPEDWLWLFLLALTPVTIIEIAKLIWQMWVSRSSRLNQQGSL